MTITAVLTRWVIVTQAAFATSMLAGLILEQPAVALADSATLSITRASNNEPWGLSVLLSRTRNRSAKFRFHNLGLLLTQFVDYTIAIYIGLYSCQILQLIPSKANHKTRLYTTVRIPLIPGLTAQTSRISNEIEIFGKRDPQHTQPSLGTYTHLHCNG